jgi:hypothetical protein
VPAPRAESAPVAGPVRHHWPQRSPKQSTPQSAEPAHEHRDSITASRVPCLGGL